MKVRIEFDTENPQGTLDLSYDGRKQKLVEKIDMCIGVHRMDRDFRVSRVDADHTRFVEEMTRDGMRVPSGAY